MSPAWPSGKAHVVVVLLHEKYVPKDLVSKIELRRNLNSILMKKDEDPVKLFEKIAALQNRFNTALYQIPLDKMIAMVLEKAPKEYGTVLTVKQRTKGSNLTMADLQEAMTQLFRTTHGVEDETEDKNKMGMAMADIKYYRCGKKGHKGYQCNKKACGKKGNGSKEKCSRCGKTGHLTDDCFDNPKNAGKRPHWYHVRKGKGKRNEEDYDKEGEVNAFCQDVAPEMLLAATDIAFPARIELLKDPNIWVAVTGTSCDSMAHHIHMVNRRVSAENNGVTLPDGNVRRTNMIDNIHGVICNRNGTKLDRCKISNVKY
eukprot:6910518-Ditylum_brightwellii.AAC.1